MRGADSIGTVTENETKETTPMYRTHGYPVDLAARSRARTRRRPLGLLPRLRAAVARIRVN